MGQFEHNLFEVNGDSGRSYRLWRRNGEPFDIPDLDLAHDTISQTGLEVVMSALDVTSRHHEGVIKVKPELDEEARQRLGALGIGEAPIAPILQ